MSPVPPSSLILVTGASGFIAAHLVSALLMRGFRVRGTVRSEDKGRYLDRLFEGVGEWSWVVVEDIAQEGAFDEAVKGVNAIAHTASPFYINATTPEELINPAVKGTRGILESVERINPSIHRLVLTSSVASIVTPKPPSPPHPSSGPYNFTESDWNDYSPRLVEEKGKDTPGPEMYRASKTLAEKAAWEFLKEREGKIGWDMVAICPPMVFGPIIHQVEAPEQLNTSVANFWAYVTGKKTDDDLTTPAGNWVDVRDVALAHYLALTLPEAGGNRFIVSNGPFCGQDIVDVLHSFPGDPLPNVPRGHPGSGAEIDKASNVFSGKKAEEVLGIEYTSLQVSVEDMYKSLKERFE